jgi:urea carboxylase
MCVYGMEGPGGYQLVGRTVQVWNTHRVTRTFVEGVPWALRFFDQICFYPVTTEELTELRRDILHGAFDPRVEATEFSLARYEGFLDSIRPGISEFKQRQTQAFSEERERWRVNGLLETAAALAEMPEEEVSERAVPEGCEAVHAPMAASVFRVAAEAGQRVVAGQRLVVLDAMKIEMEITAPVAGVVRELLCKPGQMVNAGQQLAILCES